MEFKFEGRAKLITQVFMALGLVALVGGYLTDHSDHHQRWWANLLVNGFFYFSLSLAALFFYALQYITESAWSVVIKRFFEAMLGFLPRRSGDFHCSTGGTVSHTSLVSLDGYDTLS